ncbi:MAG: aminotransferase class V-fold PLP-dependent enzyme [Bacteroidota bacterium]|nr:aminotransferase class V-fold PLP-dependent enzyme [Bacteroidota bacterium]
MAIAEKQVSKESTTQVHWDQIRAQFNLNPKYLHLGASQFIASHPKPVRKAIALYRRQLNENPVLYTQDNEMTRMQDVREAAARYLKVEDPNNIAQTDSTTMGLGLIYTGLNLQPGQEILFTEHDHYSQYESILWATKRTGASFRRIPLYQHLPEVTEEEMVEAVIQGISDKTRIVGVTWVHSSTGLKTPVSKIARAIAEINKNRDEKNKVLLLVDGVHGFGVERETFPELGCDFFIAGCHKWIYGPRGTGVVAATTEAWQTVTPIIPSFTEVMDVVSEGEGEKRPKKMDGKQMTPGGFHSLEYRWALKDAFEFMESIGPEQIYERVHALNRQCKEGLASMPHITLHTPIEDNLSSGIIAFEVEGYESKEVVEELKKKNIIATVAPYETAYARFTPGIYNTPEEIDKALNAMEDFKK